jgi:hypothetical protein
VRGRQGSNGVSLYRDGGASERKIGSAINTQASRIISPRLFRNNTDRGHIR